jgi:hypothetical protein
MHEAALVSAAGAVVGAVAVGLFLPGKRRKRDGEDDGSGGDAAADAGRRTQGGRHEPQPSRT